MWIERRKSRDIGIEAPLQSIETTIKYSWNKIKLKPKRDSSGCSSSLSSQ